MAANGKRQAKIQLDLDAGGLPAQLKEAGNRLKKFATGTVRNFGKVGLGAVKSLGMGFGIKTADAMTGFAGNLMDVERELIRYQLASSSTDAEMQTFRASLLDVSNSSGIARDQLMRGAAAYVAFTGDAKGAATSMALFADVANATGASMEDIAGVAGALRENLKIDPKDFRAGFDVLITQGKLGAVELKNLAVEISNVAPMFTKFAGGSGQEGLAKMGAIMQMMRKDFGSVEETATGFKGIMSQLARKSGDLKKVGIQVFDPKNKNQMRSFLDIVDDIGKKKAAGKLNAAMMIDLLGEQKAVNALNAVIDRRGELTQMITDAQNSNAVTKDAMKYQESAAGKIDKAWNSIKNKIAEALTPERIEKMSNALIGAADLFAGLVEKISSIVGFIADHLPSYDKNKKKMEAREEAGINTDEAIATFQARKGGTRLENMKRAMEHFDNMGKVLGGGLTNNGRLDGQALAYIGAAQKLRTQIKKEENPLFAASLLAAKTSQPELFNTAVTEDANAKQSKSTRSLAGFTLQRTDQQPAINLTVKLGDNVIAESLANATVARTKPGGR